mgnify:CR=1 FL=1
MLIHERYIRREVALATLLTFRLVGGDYEAAVLVGGQCGFGLGATPTAMARAIGAAICVGSALRRPTPPLIPIARRR